MKNLTEALKERITALISDARFLPPGSLQRFKYSICTIGVTSFVTNYSVYNFEANYCWDPEDKDAYAALVDTEGNADRIHSMAVKYRNCNWLYCILDLEDDITYGKLNLTLLEKTVSLTENMTSEKNEDVIEYMVELLEGSTSHMVSSLLSDSYHEEAVLADWLLWLGDNEKGPR